MEKKLAIALQQLIEATASFTGNIPNEVAKTLNYDYLNDSMEKGARLVQEYKERLALDNNEINGQIDSSY